MKAIEPQISKVVALRQIFKTMDPHLAQEIRESYYKVVEGLSSLAEMLERVDASLPASGGPLIEEHLIACSAMDAIKHSVLGAAL